MLHIKHYTTFYLIGKLHYRKENGVKQVMERKKTISNENLQIGQRIKTLREQRSMTQKELAEKVAVSPSSIARLESGETMTSVLTLLRIAEALDSSISFILPSDDKSERVNEEISGLIRRLSRCSKEERTDLIQNFEEIMDTIFRYK